MKIEVTQEDIINGVPMHPCHCPIALALRRAGFEAAVHLETIELDGGEHRCDLSAKAQAFIKYFDAGLVVEPFSFELEGAL